MSGSQSRSARTSHAPRTGRAVRTTRATLAARAFGTSALAVALGAPTAGAAELDARALALGGSSIADGRGVHGVVQNPASLVALQRTGVRASFLIGAGADLRDHDDVSSLLTDDDAKDIGNDLEDEVDRLSGSRVTCDPLTNGDETPCLTGTAALGALADDGLEILDRVDGNEVSGNGEARLGLAITATPVPFALHVAGRGAARGVADISDGDEDYVARLGAALGDDVLTLGEVRDNDVEFSIENRTIDITDPEEIVTSTGEGGAMYRVQFGASLATAITIGEAALDVGVTPKLSRLRAWGTRAEFVDAFDDSTPSLQDDFDDSETDLSSFTFDAGVATDLAAVPLRVAAVLRNVVPESIETPDGIEFETTPQLVVGLHHRRGRLGLTADAALNEALQDGLSTQPVGVGVEFGTRTFALRGGLGADLGREEDAVALTLGAKVGPLELGGRLSGPETGQFAAQVSFGF